MRLLLLLGLCLAFSLACAAGKDADTDVDDIDTDADADTDTDTDTDADGPFRIGGDTNESGVEGSCDSRTCIYSVYTTVPAGTVELDMTETSDDFLYHEYHDAFAAAGETGGLYVYTLELDVTDDYSEVRANVSTLLSSELLDGVTWYFYAESEDGSESDCVVTGHDPGYYSDFCTRVE